MESEDGRISKGFSNSTAHDPDLANRNLVLADPTDSSLNTEAGNLPELSLSDIETQLGPSTGFEINDVFKSLTNNADSNLNDDSPNVTEMVDVVFSSTSPFPQPSTIGTDNSTRLVNPQHQKSSLLDHSLVYPHHVVFDSSADYGQSNQHFLNMGQSQQPAHVRPSFVPIPVAQHQNQQVRTIMPPSFDPQGNNFTIIF